MRMSKYEMQEKAEQVLREAETMVGYGTPSGREAANALANIARVYAELLKSKA